MARILILFSLTEYAKLDTYSNNIAVELVLEYPDDLRDQVTQILDIHHPDNDPEWRHAVHFCVSELVGQPSCDKLLKSAEVLPHLVKCTIDLAKTYVKDEEWNIKDYWVPKKVGYAVATEMIIPAVEKQTSELIQVKLMQNINPFIIPPTQITFDLSSLINPSGSTMSVD